MGICNSHQAPNVIILKNQSGNGKVNHQNSNCGKKKLDSTPSSTITTKQSDTYDLRKLASECSVVMDEYNLTYTSSSDRSQAISNFNKLHLFEPDSVSDEQESKKKIASLKRRKRVIFISYLQLNKTIEDIPEVILQESIFCFKANPAWFFPSNQHERVEARRSIVSKISFAPKFLQLLKEKQQRGLVLWLHEHNRWQAISGQLAEICDIYTDTDTPNPIAGEATSGHSETVDSGIEIGISTATGKSGYKPLLLDISWWLDHYDMIRDSRFEIDAESVISELGLCSGKYIPTMELLHQSNSSLIPMSSFSHEEYMRLYVKKDSGLVLKAVSPDIELILLKKSLSPSPGLNNVVEDDNESSGIFEMIEEPIDCAIDEEDSEFQREMQLFFQGS